MLVRALEANEEVPTLELVAERTLSGKEGAKYKCGTGVEHAMTSPHKFYKQKPKKCLHCGKMSHIKKFCRELKRKKIITGRGKESFKKLLLQ